MDDLQDLLLLYIAGVNQLLSLFNAVLDDVTDALFEPPMTSPVVIPVNGKLEVRCRPPAGLPTPTTRSVALFTQLQQHSPVQLHSASSEMSVACILPEASDNR